MSLAAADQLLRFVLKRAEAIVPLTRKERDTNFYLVHSLGGDIGSYSPLAQLISSQFKVFGIQATKDVIESSSAWTVPRLAAHYVDELQRFQPTGPIILGGWSAGAVISLEMAQQFRMRGRSVACLVIFDGILKNTDGELRPWDPRYQLKLLCNLPRWIRDDFVRNKQYRNLVRLGKKLRAKHAIDGFLNTSNWPQSAAIFSRQLYDSLESYVPTIYDGSVLLYVAKTQPLTHLFQVAAAWTRISRCIEIVKVSGTHLSLIKEPRVRDVAEHLSRRLRTFIE